MERKDAEEAAGEVRKMSLDGESPKRDSWRDKGVAPCPLIRTVRSWRDTPVDPKWSKKDLLLVAKMDPMDAFLEVMDNKKMFQRSALEENKSHEIVALLIVILGKIHRVPLFGHLQSLSRLIFGSSVALRDDILAYVNFAVDLEANDRPNLLPFTDQVWSNLETFCSFGRIFSGGRNCWAFFTRAICGVLQDQEKDSLVEKYSVFAKLRADNENGYFYPGTIYATVEDTKKPQSLAPPAMENGKVKDAREYLDFQFSYMKASFYLDVLYNGVQEFHNLEEEQKSEFCVLVSNSYILPRVRIFESHPLTLGHPARPFLIDLAPHKRSGNELPEDIKETLTEIEKSCKCSVNGQVVFLSTSSAFENIITATVINVPDVPDSSVDQGFLAVKLLHMDNVKESIFNKDLALFFGRIVFESKNNTYVDLKMISTATLPMKEYFVDCQTAAVLPDYENIQEHDCSVEKIDLRTEDVKEEQLKVLEMNEKQFEAFQMALTRKLTLIQGPPGTGKTTVAFNIIRRLLMNTSMKILFVTFRNINLDKFILKCSTLTDKVVRIGLQIYFKEVNKYALSNSPCQDPRYKRIKNDSYFQVRVAKDILVDSIENLKDEAEESSKAVNDALRNFQESHSKFNELNSVKMYQNCQDARIIGMTSTGVAKFHDILLLLRPSVVIIEEAGVIPDSHIITSLTEHTQQLILIGDHKQFNHLQQFNYNINYPKAVFVQRLIENNLNNVYLNVQHRMHPHISDLLRETLYPDLIDGENVKLLQSIRGISKNLFCVTDENLKTMPKETLDLLQQEYPVEDISILKEVSHEMLFCAALANYLRHQGYQPHEIVILTPYLRDEGVVAASLKPFPLLEDVQVRSMDTYQNDQCRIVILSLSVRDHIELNYLLEYDYRVRVLLSRAIEGFYIVGPIDLYAEKSEIWRKIKAKLEAEDAIGPDLSIKCEKHGGERTVTDMKDVLKVTKERCSIAKELCSTDDHPCF